jgi:nicotinamide mononucleotide adenylyltransferase
MCSKKKAAAVLLLLEKEEQVKRERIIWVKNLFKRRTEKGHYENLVKGLSLEDSESYRRFLGIDTETFNFITDTVRSDIQKEMTNA